MQLKRRYDMILFEKQKRLVVIRLFPRASSPEDSRSNELLQELLGVPVPPEEEALRPVALRSLQAQQRIAFRPFLVRTWIDRALCRIERVLLLALFVFVAYWLVDGYGRDWLYQARHPEPAVAANPGLEPVPARRTAPPLPTAPAERADTVALPFVSPDMRSDAPVADYISPQRMVVAAEQSDARPRRLVVPALNVDSPVVEVFVEEGAWQVADYAVGYHHGSALPGTTGNTVMAGHAGLRGAVFRDLGQLQVGDEVLVMAGDWQYGYRVRAIKKVWPTQVEVMAATAQPVLTLITCTAWDTQRLVVVADLVESRPRS